MLRLKTEAIRFGQHGNAFGFLRLIFAALVIVSHTVEIADGNRGRELLTRWFGTLSFGDLAVDGFFIISGYLIAASYIKKPEIGSYLLRRIARIYPAFIVCSVIVLWLVAPIAGGDAGSTARALKRMVALLSPDATGVFDGTHYAVLDGSTWTIAFEFRCYLLVLVLGVAGLLHRPWVIAALAVVCQAAFVLVDPSYLARFDHQLWRGDFLVGSSNEMLRLAGVFLVGTLFYLVKDRIRFTAAGAAVAVVGCCLCLMVPMLAHAGLSVFGGYLILAAATAGGRTWLADVNNRNDISYGVYLYAFPIEKLLFWYFPAASLPVVGLSTLAGALVAGAASWFIVEKPVMEWIRMRRSPLHANAARSPI